MPEKAIKPGETIGQFKLVDVNTNEITFAWTFNGEMARRSLSELADTAARLRRRISRPAAGRERSQRRRRPKQRWGRARSPGSGFKTCQPNDSTPDGTVVGGFRKMITTTPFGKSCRWDPVK